MNEATRSRLSRVYHDSFHMWNAHNVHESPRQVVLEIPQRLHQRNSMHVGKFLGIVHETDEAAYIVAADGNCNDFPVVLEVHALVVLNALHESTRLCLGGAEKGGEINLA